MRNVFGLLVLTGLPIFTSCGPTISRDAPTGTATSDGVASGEYRIFVTSTKYSGNLGGLDGANYLCQVAAQNAGLRTTIRQ